MSPPASEQPTVTGITTRIEFLRPWAYPKQAEAIYDPKRLSLIEASTKSGKTHGCICWLIEQALFGGGNGRNYWWVAPVSVQADIAFTRMCAYLPAGTYTAIRSAPKRIILMNGAVVWFKSGDKPDSLYGDDVHAAVIDEASRFKEDAWLAVRTTLTATRGPMRIIGNVKGRRNWFYALARRAQQGDLEMGYHKMVAWDAVAAGVLAQQEILSAQSQMPEHAFRELYLAEPSDDGGNPFGIDHIRACCTLTAPTGRDVVAWGWDLAKSRDWTVGVGLDDNNAIAKFHRFQLPWRATKLAIIKETDGAPALVDSTGVGDPVLEDLQADGGSWFEGYKFTGPSKQQLMEGAQIAIQQHAIAIPAKGSENPPPDSPEHVALELEQFEWEHTRTGVRYSAPPGMHDDTVCSLALAIACRAQKRGLEVWEKLAS